MIPSYNEDIELLEKTPVAVIQIDYPREKFSMYLLDDGGTVQKRNDVDSNKSAAAWHRHREQQALCKRLGATHLTRERLEHAKAGNVNEAFKHTNGDIVLILDADHVPETDILLKTANSISASKTVLVHTPFILIRS